MSVTIDIKKTGSGDDLSLCIQSHKSIELDVDPANFDLVTIPFDLTSIEDRRKIQLMISTLQLMLRIEQ